VAGFLDGLFSGGRYEKEIKVLQNRISLEPQNYRLQVRIGDLLEKMGRRAEALKAYQLASEQYAQNGFLVQAIAIHKVILRLDPTQSQFHHRLAELYARQEMAAEERYPQRETPGESQEGQGPRPPKIPLFSDLLPAEFARVIEKLQEKWFYRGTPICTEGDPGDSIFMISHGEVAVYRRRRDQKKIFITELKEGEFFGEFGFFSKARRQGTVEAVVDTEVLEIHKQDLQEVLQEFPGVSQILFQFYKERVLDNLLVSSSLFESFSAHERRNLLRQFTLEEYPSGAMVLEEGEPGNSLYIIKSGEVEVFTIDPQGHPLSLARLQEGDFFGEISLVTGRSRTASVRVLQPAELVRLTKADFDQVIDHHPDVLKVLQESLHLRLDEKFKALGIFRDIPAKEGMV
jgi:cAMP-dependent protein kinase regulator